MSYNEKASAHNKSQVKTHNYDDNLKMALRLSKSERE